MNQGTIARLTDRGFGFIAREGVEKDLFFHSNEKAPQALPKGVFLLFLSQSMRHADRVDFFGRAGYGCGILDL